MSDYLILSCEHGGHEVPRELADLFADAGVELESHAGWDAGALDLALAIAADRAAPLVACRTTRLVVDANRDERSPDVFSARTRALGAARREELLARWHRPHRAAVEDLVGLAVGAGRRALHLSVHSFTPVLDGRPRDVDVGVLFDPRRPGEAALARDWLDELRGRAPELRCAENEPYLGVADGLTTTLRGRFEARRYVGLELEVSQGFLGLDAATWDGLRSVVVESLRTVLGARIPRP